MKKTVFFGLILCLCFSVLSGCAGQSQVPPDTSPTETVSQTPGQDPLIVQGSVTALPLMLALGEAYGQDSGMAPEVTATGKTASLDAVAAGEAGAAIIEANRDEISEGDGGAVIAYEAVAVLVNPSSGVTNLTSQQITAIFTGEAADWSYFGGTGAITLILPEPDNSFRQYFEEAFATKGSVNGIMRSLIPDAALISEQVAKDVAQTDGAIGICPAGNPAVLENAVSIDQVGLTRDTLADATYPASCAVLLVIGPAAGESVTDFSDYCMSEPAVSIIESIGYTSIK